MAKVIVVGADGSEGSRRAVEWSAELARQIDARVEVVHV
ncbi:MAG: universal stress protein, partial [Acidimicrobiia bacterium]